MKIENDLGNAVAENISLNHGVFVPPNIQPGMAFHYILQWTILILKSIYQTGNQSFMVLLLSFFKKKSKLNHELLKIRRTKSFTFQNIPFQENVIVKSNPSNEKFLTMKLQVHQLTFLRIVMVIVFGDHAK